MPTINSAPVDPAPITCSACGRPVRSPISRLLRLGSHCRGGLDERQLLAALTGAAA